MFFFYSKFEQFFFYGFKILIHVVKKKELLYISTLLFPRLTSIVFDIIIEEKLIFTLYNRFKNNY